MTIFEMSLLNMMAPPKSDFPFTNVILFRKILLEAFILNILEFSKLLIVKPLPLIVMDLFMFISSSVPLYV